MMSLLHNCEAFGDKVPKSLDAIYHKMIRTALRVRTNTPTLLLYVESGLLPIKALIEARQYKFFNRFREKSEFFKRFGEIPGFLYSNYLELPAFYAT